MTLSLGVADPLEVYLVSGDGTLVRLLDGDPLDFGVAQIDVWGTGPKTLRKVAVRNTSSTPEQVIVTGDPSGGILPLFGTSSGDLKLGPENAFILQPAGTPGDTIIGWLGLKFLMATEGSRSTTIIFRATDATAGIPATCAPTPVGGPLGWTARSPHPKGVEGSTGVLIGDKIYVTHGFDGTLVPADADTAGGYVYNVSTNAWAPIATADVPRAELVGVCAVEDGQPKVFAIGGRGAAGGPGAPVMGDVEVYSPATNSWSARLDMPTPRAGLGAAWDPRTNTIYAVGGRTGHIPHSGSALAVNEAYDLASGTWNPKSPMPVPMMDVYSTVFFRGKIYVIGGFDGTAVTALVQIYNPLSNTWSSGSPMPTPRSNLIAGVCGDHIYAVGGFTGAINLNTNEAYNPATNSWIAGQPPVPSPRSEMAWAVTYTGAEIFAIGTGIHGSPGSHHDVFTCQGGPTAGGAITPPTGMVSWWPGDGHPFDIVDGNHGILSGDATYTGDKVGQAFSFDGAGDLVEVAANSNLDISDNSPFSIDAWIKIASFSETYMQIVDRGNAYSGPGYSFGLENEYVIFQYGVIEGHTTGSTPLSLDRWYHIAVTFDGVQGNIFVDGQLDGTKVVAATSTNNVASALNIGGRNGPGEPNRWYFSGLIDEVEIFNRALSAAEIWAIYNAGSAGKIKPTGAIPTPAGMVSWWPADGHRFDIIDGNHGTLTGDATFTGGKVGQAFSFDGFDDSVQIDDSDSLDIGHNDYTIVAWIKTSSTINDGRIFSKGSSQCVTGYMMRMGGSQSSNAFLEASFNGTCIIGFAGNTTINDGQWHLVAGVVDRDLGAKIYIDGNLDASQNVITTSFDLSNDRNPRIGLNDVTNTEPFDGLIDEVAIFNRALSPAEIWAIYNAGSAGMIKPPAPIEPPAGMVAWWPGDGNTDDIVEGKHGILQGSATFTGGKVGRAFSLPTTSAAVKLPPAAINGLGDITFDAWIKTTDTVASIISGANAGAFNEYLLFIPGSDQIDFFIKDNGLRVSAPGISDGNFHHIAWVRRSTGANELYVDGVLIGGGNLPAGALAVDANGLWLGQDQDAVGGGFDPNQAFLGVMDEEEIFNRALSAAEINAIYDAGSAGKRKLTPTPMWTTKAPVPLASNGPSVGAIDGLIYAVAGWNGSHRNDLYVYYPATDTWTQKASAPIIGNGRAYGVIGGILYEAGGTNCCTQVNSVFAYDPATDSWSTKTSMPTARQEAAGGVIAGKLYVAGGIIGTTAVILANLEAFDPASNSWTTLAAMPTARTHVGGGVVNGILYVIGGFDSIPAVGVATVEAYDPATNTWSTKAPMLTPRFSVGVAVVGNILYAIGGHDVASGNVVTAVEAYNPVSNTWSTNAAMPVARAHFGTTELNGTIYAIGGDEAAVVSNRNDAFTP